MKLDVDYENGMGVSIGRLREDSMFDFKFVGLSHNTVRGAAGGAVLCSRSSDSKRVYSGKIKIEKGGFSYGNDNDTEDTGSTCRAESVTAGQLIEAKLDIVMANDITGPMALPILKQMADQVFDKEKVVFVPDHFTPEQRHTNPQRIQKRSVNLQKNRD